MHPGWDFETIDDSKVESIIYPEVAQVYRDCSNYAGRADVIRYCAIARLGGIYVDTDVMPLRPLDPLLVDPRPFAVRRSKVSFENAVLGSPAGHPAATALITSLPKWFYDHPGRSSVVQSAGPFLSSVWFGRADVRHLPEKTFYPYNGFCAPKRDKKLKIFENRDFPPKMYAAHFSNHRFGGKPLDDAAKPDIGDSSC